MAIPMYEAPKTKQEAIDIISRIAYIWNLNVYIKKDIEEETEICSKCGASIIRTFN
jgi:hypothetical protein